MLTKHKLSTKILSYLVIISCLFSLIFLGCNKSNKASILDNLVTKEGFKFEDYSWLISKEDFFKKSNLNEKDVFSNSNNQTIIKPKKNISFKNPKITVEPIYYFSKEGFVTGTYMATYKNVEDFSKACKNIKSFMDSNLKKPFMGTTDVLDSVPSDTEGYKNIVWGKNDWSRLTISISNNTKDDSKNPNYLITITTSAPKKPVKELKPKK